MKSFESYDAARLNLTKSTYTSDFSDVDSEKR
ncbi:unnamed protein product, partial [Allacma fusca]